MLEELLGKINAVNLAFLVFLSGNQAILVNYIVLCRFRVGFDNL